MALSQIVALLTRVRFPVSEEHIAPPFFFKCASLAGAMVARLPTEQEAVGSSPTSGFVKDIVAEWLTRLTANQFLSGAQVRVLPMSFVPFFFLGTWCKGSM